MKVVIQRVKKGSFYYKDELKESIKDGLVLLVGFTEGDNVEIIEYMINKIVNLRIFDDENNVMNKSILDINGEILSLSQFTLYADTKKGHRPSYKDALNSEEANILFNIFNDKLSELITVKKGLFGLDLQIELINDGPVTIILEK